MCISRICAAEVIAWYNDYVGANIHNRRLAALVIWGLC